MKLAEIKANLAELKLYYESLPPRGSTLVTFPEQDAKYLIRHLEASLAREAELLKALENVFCGRWGCGATVGDSYTMPICTDCKRKVITALAAHSKAIEELK